MTILSVQVNNPGQAGVEPQIIYIKTDSTIAQVTVPGFLNEVVAQGIPLSDTDMALVITKEFPGQRASHADFYNILFSAGNWSLVPTGNTSSGGWNIGGNVFGDSAQKIFGSLSNNNISFQAFGLEYMKFDTAGGKSIDINVNNYTLTSNGGSTTISGSSQMLLDSTSQVQISALSPVTLIGNAVGTTTIAGPNVNIVGLANSPTAEFVCYDHTTGRLTYSPAGASDAWLVGGNSFGTGALQILGTITNNPMVLIVDSNPLIKLDPGPPDSSVQITSQDFVSTNPHVFTVNVTGGAFSVGGGTIAMDGPAITFGISACTSLAIGSSACNTTQGAGTYALNVQGNATITSNSGWTHNAGVYDLISASTVSVSANSGMTISNSSGTVNFNSAGLLAMTAQHHTFGIGAAGATITGTAPGNYTIGGFRSIFLDATGNIQIGSASPGGAIDIGTGGPGGTDIGLTVGDTQFLTISGLTVGAPVTPKALFVDIGDGNKIYRAA